MQFIAYGHAGIEAKHKEALEITQHTNVVPKGELIIGTRANFDPEAVAALAQASTRLKLTLRARGITETVTGDANNDYVPGAGIILRKTGSITPQTLILNADKAAADLSRKLIQALKKPEEHIMVTIERC